MTDAETDDESILPAVLAALAAVEGVEPDALEFALYDWVESDALDALYARSPGFRSVTFAVTSHEVTVRHDGRLIVDGDEFALDELSGS